MAAFLAFGLVHGTAALWLLTALIGWQTYHFTKQNLGMFAFWCRARRMDPMSSFERRFLKATSVIGILGVLRAMDLIPSWNRPLQAVGLSLIAAAMRAVLATTRGPRMWALLLAAIFYAPVHVFSIDILGASFIYQAAHGAQYYLMVGETIRPSRNAIRLTIVLVLAGGAALLAITSPTAFHAQPWLFGLGKGIVVAHFVADASLWRLGNPKVRVIMKERFAFL